MKTLISIRAVTRHEDDEDEATPSEKHNIVYDTCMNEPRPIYTAASTVAALTAGQLYVSL